MSRSAPLISTRSPTMAAVVSTVTKYKAVSASQLRRLHYEGTPDGIETRFSRHTKTLIQRGLLRRAPYRTTLNPYGAAEYLYTLPDSTLENLKPHMHDVVELNVQLHERLGEDYLYEPEKWGVVRLGGIDLYPDAFVKVGGIVYLLEVDRSSEEPAELARKMNKYLRAGQGVVKVPYVLWTCRSVKRMEQIKRVVRARSEQAMFKVCLFDDAVEVMVGPVEAK